MKKFLVVLFALTLAVALSGDVFAKNGLTVGAGLGAKFNAGQLADTISNDGLERAGTSADVILPENSLEVLKSRGLITNLETCGSLTAVDFAINVRYDMFNFLFARLGFDYNRVLFGGETTWEYTAMAAGGAQLAGVSAANAAALIGAEHSQKWGYSAMAIPLTVGFNLPVNDGKINFYLGFGLTYAKGGFEVEIDGPTAAWTLFIGTALDTPGNTKQKVEFSTSAIGFNYLLGMDAEVYENLSVFIEVESQMVAGMSDAESLNAGATTILGTPKIAKIQVPGGQIFRVGAKYYLGYPTL